MQTTQFLRISFFFKKNSLAILLALVWTTYWSLIALLPLAPLAQGKALAAFTVELVFVSLVLITSVSCSFFAKNFKRLTPLEANLNQLIPSMLLVSILGILAFLFDLVWVQGIDYSAGISRARQQWHMVSLNRGGISSPFSVLGHIMFPFVYVAELLLLIGWDSIKNLPKKVFFVGLSLASVFMFSLATGGRSALLTFVSYFFAGIFIRFILGKKKLLSKSFISISTLSLFGLVAFFYAAWIFSARARASGLSPFSYTLKLVEFSGGRLTKQEVEKPGDLFQTAKMLGLSITTYLVHSRWTLEDLFSEPRFDNFVGSPLCTSIEWLVGRLHLITSPYLEWKRAGLFLSLPGSIWYEFGLFGVTLGGLVFGVLAAAGSLVLTGPHLSFFALAGTATLAAIFITSPLLFFSVGMPSFFSHFAFLGTGALLTLFRFRKSIQ